MKHIKKEVPARNLYIALLDDDPDGTCRIYAFADYLKEKKFPATNFFITDKVGKFVNFCDDYQAIPFADPGIFGNSGSGNDMGTKLYKNDRYIAAWLRNRPDKTFYVPWLIPISEYPDVETFSLPNIKAFCWENYKITMLLDAWLFENNPVKLFNWGWEDYSDAIYYIKKLKNPALTAVCENLSIRESTMGVRTIKEKRQALCEHYDTVWKEAMKRRGIKI